jgi:CzcA family heavy metal efflux pump
MSRSIAWWSIRQRAFVLIALVLLVAGGVQSLGGLAAGIYPEVDFPRIVVVARGGDSPPNVFQTTVTRPLEQALATTLGVQRIRSKTIRGATELSLLFAPSTDMWRALQLVQSQVATTRNVLPQGLEIEVERLTPTAFPVVTFNLSGRVDLRDLRDLAELVVRPAFARVSGVGQVRVVGGDQREVQVLLDPERLAGLHLRSTDVVQSLRERTTLAAVGRVELGAESAAAVVTSEAISLDDLGSVPIATGPGGASIALRNAALIVDGHTDRTARVGGPHGDCVLISVSRAEGASTAAVVQAVRAAASELSATLPAQVTLSRVYDQATLVEDSVASVRDAILLGVLLCLLVLGVSLRDVRAGAVAAAVVPVVLAACFLFMKLLGQTLNIMSLGGMAVAVGLVIDDAIIVVEAIVRRLDTGLSPEQAAKQGTDDLAAAVIGTTATTVIVFVPLAFVDGLVGKFFGALAGTLTIAVILSLVASLTAVPAVAALIFKPRTAHTRTSRLDQLYTRLAQWGARRRWVGVLMLCAAVGASAAMVPKIPSGFLPAMDEGSFVLDYFLPAGTSLAETARVANELERVLRAVPEVAVFARRTGAELGPAAATTANRGDIMVRLRSPRTRSTEAIIDDIRTRVAQEVPVARVEFIQVLSDVLNDLSGAPRPVEIKLFGEDPLELARIAGDVTARITPIAGLADVYGGVEAATLSEVFSVDRSAAARLHRTPQSVQDELTVALTGLTVGSIRRFDRLVPIRVRFADALRQDPQRLLASATRLDGVRGGVPLSALVTLSHERVTSEVVHEDLQPSVSVTADVNGRDIGSVSREVRAKLVGLRLPSGYRLELGGQEASQSHAFRNLALVAVAAILLTMLVLTLQFRKARPSLAVLATTPFAIVGALFTLWATQTPLNVSSLMGCVLLVGLEVKSGILLLEVAQERESCGDDAVTAVVEAGKRRIRAIMLTTTATLFGVLPLALGIGAGTDVLRPLALAVVGGITVSKFLNLVALPSLAVLIGLGGERPIATVGAKEARQTHPNQSSELRENPQAAPGREQ